MVIRVRVPCREHALLLAIVHGLRSVDTDPTAAWTLDACRILDGGQLAWETLLAEARERLLPAILPAGLEYRSAVLHRPVPDWVLHQLAAARDEQLLVELDDYASRTTASTAPEVRRAFVMAMRRFARGATLPEPTQAALSPTASVVAEFEPGSEAVWPRLAFGRVSIDWVVVRVGLELPAAELRGSCLLRLLLPELAVGSVPLVPSSGAGQTLRQTLMFPLHHEFLNAPGIDRLGICLLRDGAPLVWPGRRVAVVDLLAVRAAG